MKHYWILTSNVTGGHSIKDLGLLVPYKGEARVHRDRANWSSDLSYALSQGLVEKVREEKSRSGNVRQLPPNLATKKRENKKQEKPRSKKKSVPPEEIEELKAVNEKLASKIDQLASDQKLLMEAIQNKSSDKDQSELLSQILEAIKTRPVHHVNGGSSTPQQTEPEKENDGFVYVPKNIRRKDRKGSEDIEIVEESSSSSKMDEAAETLRKMKENN